MHGTEVIINDVMWMPIDGTEFGDIKRKIVSFLREGYNVRHSLVAIGVNPFWELMFIYSVVYFSYKQ